MKKRGEAGLEKRGAWKGLELGSLASPEGRVALHSPEVNGPVVSPVTLEKEDFGWGGTGVLDGKVWVYGGGFLATAGV